MKFDAFDGGIEPGGLRNRSEIGVLICFLLDNMNGPFAKKDLLDIIQEKGLANYFEASAALSELVDNNNAEYTDPENETVQITSNGRLISRQLNTTLSLSVRQKAVSALADFEENLKRERENPVTIKKAEGGGYDVTLRITDGMRDLMSLTIFVPDISDANAVKRSFHKNPERLYSTVLAGVTGKKEMIENALRELGAKNK